MKQQNNQLLLINLACSTETQRVDTQIYTVSQKNCAKFFRHNFVKFTPTVIIFGTLIAERIYLCNVHLFSTSTNSRQRPTVLNVDVPNCYITVYSLVL